MENLTNTNNQINTQDDPNIITISPDQTQPADGAGAGLSDKAKQLRIKIMLCVLLLAIGAGAVIFMLIYDYRTAPRFGVIGGIIYNKDDPAAMVEAEIVKEGDEVFGVTVVKINSDSIEFRKGTKTWTQKVREKPNLIWPRKKK